MLLTARDRVQCEQQTTEALELMPMSMVLPTMTTKNAKITHKKLSRGHHVLGLILGMHHPQGCGPFWRIQPIDIDEASL